MTSSACSSASRARRARAATIRSRTSARRVADLELLDVLGQVARRHALVDVLVAGEGGELLDAGLDVVAGAAAPGPRSNRGRRRRAPSRRPRSPRRARSTPRSRWARSTASHSRRSSTTFVSGDHRSTSSGDAYRDGQDVRRPARRCHPPICDPAVTPARRWRAHAAPLDARGALEPLARPSSVIASIWTPAGPRSSRRRPRPWPPGRPGHLHRGVERVDAVQGAARQRHADHRQRGWAATAPGEVGGHACAADDRRRSRAPGPTTRTRPPRRACGGRTAPARRPRCRTARASRPQAASSPRRGASP